MKILLVENSRTARAAISQQITRWGHNVDTVSNAIEAIEKIKSDNFDVAILDIFMPQMNGYEAAKAIRALPDERGTITLIAFTASQDPNDYNLCMDAGMDEFILKSDKNEELQATLKRLSESS